MAEVLNTRTESKKVANIVHLTDCMEFMRTLPDDYYDLSIVDPPYGLRRSKGGGGPMRFLDSGGLNIKKSTLDWDEKPEPEFFTELFRVSKKQIIWGANNFSLPQTEYFIVWDKQQTVPNFASAEYAWTNIELPAKVFRYSVHRVMQDRRRQGGKVHPTEKPVALYTWLLEEYAKPGDKIFDSHVGSGSIRIACRDLGFDFEGCEIDVGYWQAQEDRYNQYIQQLVLDFSPPVLPKIVPRELPVWTTSDDLLVY